MSFGDARLIEILETLHASSAHCPVLRAAVAFDGFVDEIKRIIKDVDPQGMPTYYSSKSEFLDAMGNDSHNKELRLETVCRKIGGSGVLVTSALAELGAEAEAWVTAGQSADFQYLRSKAVLHDIGQPPLTWALEFDTGKIMMADHSSLNGLDWAHFQMKVDMEQFCRRVESSDCLILTGYAILQHGHALYEAVCTEVLPKLQNRPRVFLDLADISSKRREALEKLQGLLKKFGQLTDTTVLLNRNECETLLPAPGQHRSARQLAEQIGQVIAPCAVVVHTARESAVYRNGCTAVALHPKLLHTAVRTGSGDHFCAGYCLGSTMSLPETVSLQLAAAVAQCYMACGSSPTLEQLLVFLRHRNQEQTMPYRMIAMDFDGTILDPSHRIPPRTARMLRQAGAAGVLLCVNTGRSYYDTMRLIRDCDCFDYIITSNGCDVRTASQPVPLVCKTLEMETVTGAIDLLKAFDVYFECFVQGQAVTETALVELVKVDAEGYADYLQGGGDGVLVVESLKEYIAAEARSVSKLYVMADSSGQAARIRRALQSVQGLCCTSSGDENIEVIPPHTDKAHGVELAARHAGMDLSQVIALGDGENDMEMIRRCGCGVAMANGLPELQACADYVCSDVSSEGAADAIGYFTGIG